MKPPSPTALIQRARALVVRMHVVERWAYAVDASVSREKLERAIGDAGYALVERDAEAKVTRYEAPSLSEASSAPDALVTLERPDLELILMQAYGSTTPDRLRPVLTATGFVPQSQLLRSAYAVGEAGSSRALTALAHMVVAWDDDWADLFLLHLASPDPVARHEACLATVVAALSAGAREPARTLLNEAHARERFPQLKTTLAEAAAVVDAIAGANGPQP
jgi:hypothetical protein